MTEATVADTRFALNTETKVAGPQLTEEQHQQRYQQRQLVHAG
jgi:hypothetical protein